MTQTVGDLVETLMQLPLTLPVLLVEGEDEGYPVYAGFDVSLTHTFKGEQVVLVSPL